MHLVIEVKLSDGRVVASDVTSTQASVERDFAVPLVADGAILYGFVLRPKGAVACPTREDRERVDLLARLRETLALVHAYLAGDPAATRDGLLNHLLACGLGVPE